MTAALPAAVLTAALAAAPASTGVGIQANPVCLPAPARPGHAYQLGTVYVTDTGTSTEDITLHAQSLQGPARYRSQLPVPPGWVSIGYPRLLWIIGQDHITLTAGQGAYLPVTLTIPPQARPGTYVTDLIAAAAASAAGGSGARAVTGAGATTPLIFTITTPTPATACTSLPPFGARGPRGTTAAAPRSQPAAPTAPAPGSSTRALAVAGGAVIVLLCAAGVRRRRAGR